MTTVNQVLAIAQRELGQQEQPTDMTKYGEWYGTNGQAWCATFVSYCLYHAGFRLSIQPDKSDKGFGYCPSGLNWYKEQKQWIKDSPLPGDIVFFDWENDKEANHVGLFVCMRQDGKIITIEGNSKPDDKSNGGEVRYKVRDFVADGVMGFGRPAYTKSSSVAVPPWSGERVKLISPLMKSSELKTWQQQMIKRGYDLGAKGADGVFGSLSDRALKNFQSQLGFRVDGILDALAWQAAWTA
jgi:CHAP domain/Putative peptidoglycan binding domain